jgi:hypothetical protein
MSLSYIIKVIAIYAQVECNIFLAIAATLGYSFGFFQSAS